MIPLIKQEHFVEQKGKAERDKVMLNKCLTECIANKRTLLTVD